MAIYRIKDWDTRYENNRTRGYKHLDWVPMPNKMDGDGYTELVQLSAGEKEYYGALRFAGWCAIVEIASRCDPRGTLCRNSAGVCGHTAESLSRISRLPKLVFDLVFTRALQVGWLEDISNENKDLHDTAEILHKGALNRIEENRIEEKGKEKNVTLTLSESVQFFKENYSISKILNDKSLVTLYESFLTMRKIKGRPVKTKFGVIGHIRDLEKSANPRLMLEWSTGKEYQGLFDPPEERSKNGHTAEMKPQKLSAAAMQTAINLGVNPDEL